MFNFSKESPNCFSQLLNHFTFPPLMYEGSNYSTSSPTLVFCLCVCVREREREREREGRKAILMVEKWQLTVVLICNFPNTSDVEHLFMCLLPFVDLLWRTVYSSPLPIFEMSCLLFSSYSSLHTLDINPYQIHALQIFYPILWVCFLLS